MENADRTDELYAKLCEENTKVREMLKEFIDYEDGLRQAVSRGGQHVGRSPSISPTVLRKLKRIYEGESGL